MIYSKGHGKWVAGGKWVDMDAESDELKATERKRSNADLFRFRSVYR